ncbi:MAG: hypothetical protein ACT4P3_05455 [Betaproteobacteria bacterium]
MRLLLAGMALTLAACAELRPIADPYQPVDAIVAEAVGAARAPVPEQKAALQRAQQSLAARPSALNRLRLAVLLATLPAPLRDDTRAAELLESLADSNSPGPGRFAALFAAQVAERQRIARELDRLGRDAERAARERERLDRERERADKERDKREDTLRQQLEALRSIERGILEREEKLRRRQR